MLTKFSVVNFLIFCHFIQLAFAKNNTDLSDFKVVQTENGLIRGKKLSTLFNKNPYYSFKGIRYGKAPIKELRFKVNKLWIFFYRSKLQSQRKLNL